MAIKGQLGYTTKAEAFALYIYCSSRDYYGVFGYIFSIYSPLQDKYFHLFIYI
jgi:hypothetical protein